MFGAPGVGVGASHGRRVPCHSAAPCPSPSVSTASTLVLSFPSDSALFRIRFPLCKFKNRPVLWLCKAQLRAAVLWSRWLRVGALGRWSDPGCWTPWWFLAERGVGSRCLVRGAISGYGLGLVSATLGHQTSSFPPALPSPSLCCLLTEISENKSQNKHFLLYFAPAVKSG